MSKKLIAVAAAAALAMSGLVATTSASALPVVKDEAAGLSYLSVTASNNRDGSGTAADPFTFPVPNAGTVAATDEVLSFAVSSTLKSRAATVTTSSGIKLLDARGDGTNKYTAASGQDSLALTTTSSGTLNFVAYPTSTSTGIVTLTITDPTTTPATIDTTQVYIKGTTVAGNIYSIRSVTPPTTIAPEGKGLFTAVLVDAFGNVVEDGSAAVTLVGGGDSTFADAAAASNITWSDTTKRHEGTLTAGKISGQIAVQVSIGVTPTPDQLAAFGANNPTFFTIITTLSVAEQVAALTAQVAALQAMVDNMRTKARSVTLKRWNNLVKRHRALGGSAKLK